MSYINAAKKYIKQNPNLKLPERFKERWLTALTDGSYKQATGELIVIEEDEVQGHCCLGVACRIQGLSQSVISNYGAIGQDLVEIAKKRKKNIPRILQTDDRGNNFVHNPVVKYLIELNDGSVNFKKVSKFIERYL